MGEKTEQQQETEVVVVDSSTDRKAKVSNIFEYRLLSVKQAKQRSENLSRIRNLIRNGQYQPDIKDVAEKVDEELFLDVC